MYTFAHIYVHIFIYIHVCVNTRMYIHTYIHIRNTQTYHHIFMLHVQIYVPIYSLSGFGLNPSLLYTCVWACSRPSSSYTFSTHNRPTGTPHAHTTLSLTSPLSLFLSLSLEIHPRVFRHVHNTQPPNWYSTYIHSLSIFSSFTTHNRLTGTQHTYTLFPSFPRSQHTTAS